MFRMSPVSRNDPDPELGSSPARLYEETCKIFAPKPEELAYKCTNEELKLLCKTFEVQVDMTKFNVLDHFYHIFKKRGSLEGRSKQSTLRLLTRASNHYKNDKNHVYSDQEIKEILQEERELRKAESVRFLKEHNENLAHQSSDESDVSQVTVINSEPQPELVPNMPHYVEEFFELMEVMAPGQQISLLSDSEEIQPTPSNTSLQNIESEVMNITSEDTNLNTNDLANSVIPSQQNNANSEDYQSFDRGNPVTSTQDP